ncbi:MFS transporter, partial [Vibrio vulnificus]|nr:MFS transporter [Vibrio vulnificus]
QFSGINGVLYYTPQILDQAGVGVLLSNLGISSASASLLISAITTLLMLPCIAVAMRLMDLSGRRYHSDFCRLKSRLCVVHGI